MGFRDSFVTLKERASSFIPLRRGSSGAYKGASLIDPATAGWNPVRMSPNAALLPEQDRLTSRAQDSDRNNGIARAAIQTHVDNVVGTGLLLSARPDWRALEKSEEWAEEWSRDVEEKWCAWWWSTDCHAADTLTGDQLTSQIYRAQLQNGEAIVLPYWLPDPRRQYATRLLSVDSYRLSNPTIAPETLRFHGGIEFDEYGGPQAYHIKRTNPGDRFMDASGAYGPESWERIPRRGPNGRLRVLHIFEQRSAGQSRGEPLLTAVLPLFKQLDRYCDAEVMAAVVNACVAGVITTPMAADQIADLFQNDRQSYLNERRNYEVNLKPGTLATLFPGDALSEFMPSRPSSGFGPFVENVIRIIAVGVDMPYELLFKDFSKANYSSMRAAMLEAWRAFTRRRDTLATQFLDPTYDLWLEEAASAGLIDAPNFYANRLLYKRCRWIGAGRGWVDPGREADASEKRMTIGISTLEDECAEQGKRWRDVLEQRAIEKAYADKLGVTLFQPVAAGPNADPNVAEGDPNSQPEDNAAPGDAKPKNTNDAGYAVAG